MMLSFKLIVEESFGLLEPLITAADPLVMFMPNEKLVLFSEVFWTSLSILADADSEGSDEKCDSLVLSLEISVD